MRWCECEGKRNDWREGWRVVREDMMACLENWQAPYFTRFVDERT